jgi:hypothetical protein
MIDFNSSFGINMCFDKKDIQKELNYYISQYKEKQ